MTLLVETFLVVFLKSKLMSKFSILQIRTWTQTRGHQRNPNMVLTLYRNEPSMCSQCKIDVRWNSLTVYIYRKVTVSAMDL